MALHYYAQRKSIKENQPQLPVNKYGTEADMEYQYLLFCASAVKNEAKNDFDALEWGTIENGMRERKIYDQLKRQQQEEETET